MLFSAFILSISDLCALSSAGELMFVRSTKVVKSHDGDEEIGDKDRRLEILVVDGLSTPKFQVDIGLAMAWGC